ncbi:MAG: hypothetical protein GXP46_08730 [Deferribacteres bacterium]|nr:hypothetical protein [Deferribacteres bacterium]
MKSRNSYLIPGVLIIALLLPYSALAGWRTGCVDCPRYFDGMNSRSLALDSSGNPHIVYGSRDGVYYAWYDGVSWHTETVNIDGGIFASIAIAIDSSDKVHIIYYDGYPNRALKYATNASGSWVSEVVDSDGGWATSIAIDSSDKVHISYSYYRGYPDYINALKYATNASGSWVSEVVDSDGGWATSIAIDSSDKVISVIMLVIQIMT